MRADRWLVVALVGVLLMTGCTEGSVGPAPADTPIAATGLREWVAHVVDCLNEQGWADAAINPDGTGIEMANLPAAQGEAFAAARTTCESQAGPQPNATALTRDDVAALFDQLVASRACLVDLGYPISEAPSRAAFIDQYFSDRDPWNPYVELPDLDAAEWARVNEACPQPG